MRHIFRVCCLSCANATAEGTDRVGEIKPAESAEVSSTCYTTLGDFYNIAKIENLTFSPQACVNVLLKKGEEKEGSYSLG
jgi:hypothetical protein